ncbi:MAG: hypothetical protein R2912_08650 [Eubacteriales bacterium]
MESHQVLWTQWREVLHALDRAMHAMMKMAMTLELGTGMFVTGAQMLLQAGVGIVVFVGVNLLTGGNIELIPLLIFLPDRGAHLRAGDDRVYAPAGALPPQAGDEAYAP